MNTNITLDVNEEVLPEKPGAFLASIRLQKNLSAEYVADKLHLRVRIIELLEADEYNLMPEPVFIKGYIRGYAKLLNIAPDSILETFNKIYASERKPERMLWQSRRETNKAERVIRYLTAICAAGVIIAVGIWWNSNKENENLIPKNISQTAEASANKSESEIRLTDLSKMRSLLSSVSQNASETTGG